MIKNFQNCETRSKNCEYKIQDYAKSPRFTQKLYKLYKRQAK